MSEFIQLHVLTSYPPANLNRDDLNRPKTAVMGGVKRLRVSSQCLKRSWRTSDLFEEAMAGHVGVRTKEMGAKICQALVNGQTLRAVLAGEEEATREKVPEKTALKMAASIARQYGKLKAGDGEKGLHIEQLAHFSPGEIDAIDAVLAQAGAENAAAEAAAPIRQHTQAVDIAMFGRMMAATQAANIEAAVQVAHALTVHGVVVEDDYFSAVDDLNTGEESAASAHLGEVEFGAGLFYEYVCINRTALVENLGGDEALALRGMKALIECIAKVAPSGKQNSFGSRAYASFVRAERGPQQPRSLAVAFLKPVSKPDYLSEAKTALTETAERMNASYGACYDSMCVMDASAGEGTLDDIRKFTE